MAEPIFYIVELDLDDADFKPFMQWYANVHTPHLYEAGFTLCTSYRGLSGDMKMVDIYQASGWDIFERDTFSNYRKVAAADPHKPPFIGPNRNTRTPYTHVQWQKPADDNIARPLVTDWISLWRFETDGVFLDRVASWLGESGAAELTARGVSHIRLLRKEKDAPTGSSMRPGGCIVLQWNEEPTAELISTAGLPDWLAEAIGKVDGFSGYRVWPWADDPTIRERFETGRD